MMPRALRIAHLYVSGCEDGIAEEVLAHAESYRNENILAADLRALQCRIESNPWIEQAIIRRTVSRYGFNHGQCA